jgi:subtilisin family serine protease
VIRGLGNGSGITGIAPESLFGFFGFIEGEQADVDARYIRAINHAIRSALSHLDAGDVLVMEQHMAGPDENRYIAVEYWPEIFAELKKVTEKGVHCIEAAGNGSANFDKAVYGGAFDLNVRDSGCIVVGAGSTGSHERLFFSNYGSRVDVHAYGENVTTTGYGDLFNGGITRMYTESFSGTSSATPIVAGAVAVISSIAKAQGRLVTPTEMRGALRRTGTPQGNRTRRQRIGPMPSIPQALQALGISRLF